MTKSKTIIATLGIVAGLGAAALPLASYAATVSGNVEVIVEVEPAIAMTIDGNNDSATGYGQVVRYDDGTGTVTSGTKSLQGQSFTLNTNVSSSKATLTPNSKEEGGVSGSTFASTIKVSTNNRAGYTLNVKAETAADVDLTSENNDTIPAITAAGNLTEGTAAWGLKAGAEYDSAAASIVIKNDKFYPITDSDQLIRTTASSATGYDRNETVVNYGVATANNQATGTYQSTLVYTAATK